MKIDVVLGLQWGDEGKGKIVDVLTPEYDIIARFQGGPNAGHTICIAGEKHVLHTIPSGIFHKGKVNIIGNGVIVDPFILWQEISALRAIGIDPAVNLKISKRAHLILPTHRLLDAVYEQAMGESKIGSTLKGIGPCYTDRTARFGVRFGDILSHDFIQKYNKLKERHLRILSSYNFDPSVQIIDGQPFAEYEKKWVEASKQLKEIEFIDSEIYINRALAEGRSVMAEGAQGSLLDVDFGSYPFVTSSNTIAAGVCSGLGVPPSSIGKIYGVFKAYCTRVGSGPFPTELLDETGQKLRSYGQEFGSTTGRPRRCGWLDIPSLKYSIMLNGVTHLVMMKADVLNDFDLIKVCTGYEINGVKNSDLTYETMSCKVIPHYETWKGWNTSLNRASSYSELPSQLTKYINEIEKSVNLKVAIVSTGPDREQTVIR
jgi:adenylosuccinate synthase